MNKIIKSLRLIRLIRIIKLYKYIASSGDKPEDENNQKKKKKKKDTEKKKEDEVEESLFKKETDPTKLGKALSESINRRTIIGVLLMLMTLPLLRRSKTDFSGEFILREVFWMGRSNCMDAKDPYGFECNNAKWIT